MTKEITLQYFGIALAWGTSFYLIKLALQDFSPIQVTFLRSFLGFSTIYFWCKFRSISIPRPSKLWIHLAALSILLNTAPSFLFAFAETHVSSTLAGLLNATTPLFTVIIVAIILKNEEITKRQYFGVLLGFVGIIFLIGFKNELGRNSLSAILALLLAILCFAISYPYIKTFLATSKEASEGMIAVQLGLSSIWILPFLIMDHQMAISVSKSSLAAVVALGAFASGFAYVWNIEITKSLGSGLASTVSYLIPVVSSISGAIFLGETLSLTQILGGALIMGSIWLSQKRY